MDFGIVSFYQIIIFFLLYYLIFLKKIFFFVNLTRTVKIKIKIYKINEPEIYTFLKAQ